MVSFRFGTDVGTEAGGTVSRSVGSEPLGGLEAVSVSNDSGGSPREGLVAGEREGEAAGVVPFFLGRIRLNFPKKDRGFESILKSSQLQPFGECSWAWRSSGGWWWEFGSNCDLTLLRDPHRSKLLVNDGHHNTMCLISRLGGPQTNRRPLTRRILR